MARIITLLTDFGTADGYVGEMKGVMAVGAPACTIVDISHDIEPQDVEGGRLALARYWQRFPEGTIHIVVVDPGVGGQRAALAVESERRLLVGPDNGVLSPSLLHPGARCVTLATPSTAAPTFHGRDVFAPAAVHLALGMALDDVGAPFEVPIITRTPEATRRPDGATAGVVIDIDRFGNIITNLVARRGGTVEFGGQQIAISHTYSDVAPGEVVALVGSSGLVEIAIRNGNAATAFSARRGAGVALKQNN